MRKLTQRPLVWLAGFVAACCLTGVSAHAQQIYPSKTVKIVAGYPPGGGTDTQARLMAEKLGQHWGVPVVVDNMPGSLGVVSARAVASAPPDGYTLYLGTFDHLILGYSLTKDKSFDTQSDFIPISSVADQSVVIVVNPTVPVKTLQELVDQAKAQPGVLTYASVGVGSMAHLSAELFQSRKGVRMLHVPYKGTAQALVDLMSGQGGDVMFASLATVAPHIQAGKIRALAVTSAERSPLLPDVPTAEEAGLADFVMATWNGLFLPAGTPDSVVREVSNATRTVLDLPELKQRFQDLGLEPANMTSEEFAKMIDDDLKTWQKVIADADIVAQ